jgi:ATP-dependent Zn protease
VEATDVFDRVAKVSVIPRGVAALGYTQQQPTEDRYLMTRTELLDRLDNRRRLDVAIAMRAVRPATRR